MVTPLTPLRGAAPPNAGHAPVLHDADGAALLLLLQKREALLVAWPQVW
jgi:hypothetical protein